MPFRKRRLLPFTQQYFHMRELQKQGKMPQFGSYKYSAQRFYDKGILLSIENYSPRQFDKLDIVLSSNAVGVFTIEIFNHTLGITNRMATADVKMEDLLQAQFEDRASLSLFNGLAKFNLNLLLWQINKKYVTLLMYISLGNTKNTNSYPGSTDSIHVMTPLAFPVLIYDNVMTSWPYHTLLLIPVLTFTRVPIR